MLNQNELTAYIARQLDNLFPDGSVEPAEMEVYIKTAIKRFKHSYDVIDDKYFNADGDLVLNHLHTDQYALFLYFLSNTIFRRKGDAALASKVYALNKALHAVDLFYEVELPDIFCLVHPVGTVLGRANYSNHLVVYQRCSVGSNTEQDRPTLEEGVVMFGNSAIIGKCHIGPNAWLSFGTIIMDQDVPPDSVVFGRSPNLTIKPTKRNVIRDRFNAT